MKFIQGDATQLIAQDNRFEAGSVDFTFSRLVMAGLKGWQLYVRRVAQMLKPGGYVEMQEPSFAYFIDGTEVSASWPWLQAFSTAMNSRGMDPLAGGHLARYMQNAGLVNIQVRTYEWPWGDWKANRGHEEVRRFGTHLGQTMPATWQGLLGKMLDGQGYSEERMNEFLQACHRDMQPREGMYMSYYVVCGRKAM